MGSTPPSAADEEVVRGSGGNQSRKSGFNGGLFYLPLCGFRLAFKLSPTLLRGVTCRPPIFTKLCRHFSLAASTIEMAEWLPITLYITRESTHRTLLPPEVIT
ncbi:hypothetical protein V6N13_094047 [Hibiscus sabdariffa]|uniref:Uncharacterized protein n=2 Tax=Hibiscus sabdariffa TaxID=183260 RepID=A0ABR2ABI1_9ROSI